MMNIELQPEYIISVFGVFITNTFLTSVLVTGLLAVFGTVFYLRRARHGGVAVNGLRILIFELLKLTDNVTGDRELSKKILPLIATFFLFIVTANLLSLIPGFLGSLFVATPEGSHSLLRSPNSDLTTTLALALFSVASIQYFSLSALGLKGYLMRFFNFTSPVAFIIGFFEMISESVKILSFSFRLFGNVFAGEVLLLVIAFLVPYIIPLPFIILEVFVGIIQAFIFAALTLTFIKTSTMRHVRAAQGAA
jgi:F-type H+-transporting ATPase subunit a